MPESRSGGTTRSSISRMHRDGLRMNELAERILYSKSGFTRVVDRMEEADLVRRVRPENDRRSFLIVLTDAGRKTLERPAGTTGTGSRSTSRATSTTPTSRRSPGPSRRSARTRARCARAHRG